jgi:hypothetical protein
MPLGSDADLDFMLQDAGNATQATYGTQSCYGVLEQSDVLEGSGDGAMIQVRATTFLFRTSALRDLVDNAAITIGGQRFKIRRNDLEDDGHLTRLILARNTT